MKLLLEKTCCLLSRRPVQYLLTGLLVVIGMFLASPQHAWAQG